MNATKPGFTYSNNSGLIQSRIDYIFTSLYMRNLVKKKYILTPPKVPDHKAVVCSFKEELDIGKGYWKLNVKLLEDDAYSAHIKHVIQEVKRVYSPHLDKRQLWDYCKTQIKEESIQWS